MICIYCPFFGTASKAIKDGEQYYYIVCDRNTRTVFPDKIARKEHINRYCVSIDEYRNCPTATALLQKYSEIYGEDF